MSFGLLGQPGAGAGHPDPTKTAENEPDPYKGGGPLVQDLLGGITDIGISAPPRSVHIRAGKIRRSPSPARRARPLPDTPTLAEQGIKPSRPIRGGASMRRPGYRARSSTACAEILGGARPA